MHVFNKKYRKQKTNNTKIQTAWSSVKYLIIVYQENPPWAEHSGGSRNFKTGEGAWSRRGRIFRSWVCFDAPSHIPYVFAARVVNEIHNVNIGY